LEIDYEDRTIPNSSFLILNSSFLFLFALSREEILNLSQFVISSKMKHSPNVFAFTEQGVAMLSSVLRSPRAVQVNIEIMRAFVRLRQMMTSHADLSRKLEALEKKYDVQFRVVFDAIRQLMRPSHPKRRRRIGFCAGDS
jgi:hypothetical protein